ncbi:conserved unknown protein [Ectocarpus siliculosus]|uniref:Agd3 deacetylase domain-containing protein n=1 Tax=Ectocarpus siliculosus TaxID=2880 RepID=D8LD68_ECTSI|nr:conserved unknown protein [Ectocarpus siliculosus]|eukprot:CBN75521.1 conserved unknown protein [Ectocarpus siliculosus]
MAGGAAVARVVPSTLTTNPREFNIFTRPVLVTNLATTGNGTATVMAEYVDDSGANVPSSLSFPSVAAMAYASDDGYEELHLFFSVAWFDTGSWAWAHFFIEWGTKGVFQGERRFYLAGMVDDLFLATGVFEYDGDTNEGAEVRLTSSDMSAFASFESSLNSQYGSSIVTEWPFNGLGILEVVDSAFVLDIANADIALLPKGQQVSGDAPRRLAGYRRPRHDGRVRRRLLGRGRSARMGAGQPGHVLVAEPHPLAPLEGRPGGVGLHHRGRRDNYNWRSLTSPGITGHFNKFCLTSATSNLMKDSCMRVYKPRGLRTLCQTLTCAPGDNTYDGVQTDVSLISSVSQFHSIYTTESNNGFSGFQNVPRYPTFVYFNCATGNCLVNENEFIRRSTCGCSNLNPAEDQGSCSLCDDIQSFGNVEALYETEAKTTTRQILMGRRDKYMFHQANVVQNSAVPGGSLLAYWYQEVMELFSQFISFPVTLACPDRRGRRYHRAS